MAPKKSTIVLNVEQFIRDIEERPAIWNRNFHCNKAFLEQMWDELSAQHKLPKVILKAKWKGLRDNFRVEYKRIPRGEHGDFLVEPAVFESKWIHYYALLFLTEHMRHRMPKTEQDQSYFFTQQSQDCEKTVVEPDLTNGLIRRLQDSDEEFDEDDVDDDDDGGGDVTGTIEAVPPIAHANSMTSTSPAASAIIKTEDTRSLLKAANGLLKVHVSASLDGIEKEAQDLSKKSKDTAKIVTVCTSSSAAASPASSSSCITSTTSTVLLSVNQAISTPIGRESRSVTNGNTSTSSLAIVQQQQQQQQQQHKKRSVSPPPLYNKAHHPPPNTAATSLNSAAALSKDRDDFGLNGNSCLHGSHEHLTFTKHSYSNGLIPALKLKRPRLSEDSNFNGSSTMDNSTTLVPEDDDYHYLLSLHPYMKQLTAAQKLRIRTKIQKLMFKELYKEDLEETK